MTTIEDLMRARFDERYTRSVEFREGCRAFLTRRIQGVSASLHCPYPLGGASYDAWWFGVEERKDIWRDCDVPTLIPPPKR